MTNWPVYSAAARQAHREGVVLLSVTISADGNPSDVKIARSSNVADFDAAAVIAVQKWKFTPATRDGTATETTVNLPVNFSLKTTETPAAAAAPPPPTPKVAKKIAPKPKPVAKKPVTPQPANNPEDVTGSTNVD